MFVKQETRGYWKCLHLPLPFFMIDAEGFHLYNLWVLAIEKIGGLTCGPKTVRKCI